MRRIFFLLFVFLGLTATYGQTSAPQMLVNPASGQSTAFALSTLRTITFEGAYLVVTTQSGETSSYAINLVRSITFGNLPEYTDPEIIVPSSTEDLEQSVTFAREGNNLIISGISTDARMYSAVGQLITTVRASDGVAVLPMGNCPNGTYIIIADNQPYKFNY